MKIKKAGFTSIDEYIVTLPEDTQKGMEAIRAAIKSVAPKAEEKISYQMAAFKLDGHYIAHFAGWKKHIGMYPIPAGDAAFQKEVLPYKGVKSSLQFPLDKPMPLKLIRKMIKFRIVENKNIGRDKAQLEKKNIRKK
jgi:uncharacterized protein YdhG (YjbR/CyaY superfamily)